MVQTPGKRLDFCDLTFDFDFPCTIVCPMPDSTQTKRAPKLVAVVSKPGRPELATALPTLVAWLKERGHSVVMDLESHDYFPSGDAIPRDQMGTRSPWLALVLGGDGTLL